MKKEGGLYPNFPLEKIIAPLGFTPSKRLFSEKTGEQKGSIIDGIVTRICEKTNQSHQQILEEITQEEKESHILPEVAALYVARKHGVEVNEWYEPVESTLLTGNT